LAKAGREIKDALARDSVFINGVAKGSQDNMLTQAIFARENALHGRFFLIRLGKKKYYLFKRI
jgi:tyrosyl-tRNA synthetase